MEDPPLKVKPNPDEWKQTKGMTQSKITAEVYH